jgi:hypothetical protein
LQVNAWASWDLERNLKAFEAENCNANEGIRGTVKNSDLANDGSEIGIVRGALSLAITKLDPLRNVPRLSCETEVSYSGRVCDWEITATVDRSIILELC